jgi:hypothetical protein
MMLRHSRAKSTSVALKLSGEYLLSHSCTQQRQTVLNHLRPRTATCTIPVGIPKTNAALAGVVEL